MFSRFLADFLAPALKPPRHSTRTQFDSLDVRYAWPELSLKNMAIINAHHLHIDALMHSTDYQAPAHPLKRLSHRWA